MSCGVKKYPGINPDSWTNEIEETKAFKAINTEFVSVLISVATLVLALFTFLKK